jgi:hypothetical protein
MPSNRSPWKDAVRSFQEDTGVDLLTSKDIDKVDSEHSLQLALSSIRLQSSKAHQKQRTSLLGLLKPISSFCTSAMVILAPALSDVGLLCSTAVTVD